MASSIIPMKAPRHDPTLALAWLDALEPVIRAGRLRTRKMGTEILVQALRVAGIQARTMSRAVRSSRAHHTSIACSSHTPGFIHLPCVEGQLFSFDGFEGEHAWQIALSNHHASQISKAGRTGSTGHLRHHTRYEPPGTPLLAPNPLEKPSRLDASGRYDLSPADREIASMLTDALRRMRHSEDHELRGLRDRRGVLLGRAPRVAHRVPALRAVRHPQAGPGVRPRHPARPRPRAGAAVGAVAAASGMAAAMTMASATHVAGGASAIKAAFDAAQGNMESGGGMFSGGGQGGGQGQAQAGWTVGQHEFERFFKGPVGADKTFAVMVEGQDPEPVDGDVDGGEGHGRPHHGQGRPVGRQHPVEEPPEQGLLRHRGQGVGTGHCGFHRLHTGQCVARHACSDGNGQ